MSGTAVGMFSFTISSSGTLSRYFTRARSELPCAAIMTLLPFFSAGTIVLFQKGSTRLIVSSRDSDSGSSRFGMLSYFLSNFGWKGLSSAMGGGGIAYERRHWVTCSSPNFSVVSALFMPCKSPYILSFSRHVFVTGIHSKSISSKARARVLIARFCRDVKAKSTVTFASRSSLPAVMASAVPSSVTSTSTHPVNRFSKFHCDWPCRTRTRVYVP
mmetsp:Transcript_131720/g.367192  ORF Transcript_131720/g.367192 Transcript_131720/m.367192 type:complete len:215 (+) Transcript_131720:221-865(+)